jgi:hypothetical protein
MNSMYYIFGISSFKVGVAVACLDEVLYINFFIPNEQLYSLELLILR